LFLLKLSQCHVLHPEKLKTPLRRNFGSQQVILVKMHMANIFLLAWLHLDGSRCISVAGFDVVGHGLSPKELCDVDLTVPNIFDRYN